MVRLDTPAEAALKSASTKHLLAAFRLSRYKRSDRHSDPGLVEFVHGDGDGNTAGRNLSARTRSSL